LVVGVHPDPVGTAPPELAIVVRLYANGAITVGVDGVAAPPIILVVRVYIKLQVNMICVGRGEEAR